MALNKLSKVEIDRWVRFLGLVGFVLFMLGFVGYLILGKFAVPLMVFHMAFGALLAVLWFFAYGFKNLASLKDIICGRNARFGVNVLLYTCVFAGFLILINWLAHRYNSRWDFSEAKVYSLAAQSKQIVRDLKKPLKMVAFLTKRGSAEEKIKELFALYRYENREYIETRFVDPVARPDIVEHYAMPQGYLVYLQYGEGQDKRSSRLKTASEEALSAALVKLVKGTEKKIYYIQGHGEHELDNSKAFGLSELVSAAADEHLKIEALILAQRKLIPKDASAVVLVAPKKAIPKDKIQLLIKYIKDGGRLLLLSDPGGSKDLKTIADHFGIKINNDIVVEWVKQSHGVSDLVMRPVIKTYAEHLITQNFSPQHLTIFNIASSITVSSKPQGKAQYQQLLQTSKNSWGELDLSSVFGTDLPTAKKDQQDHGGPLTLAVAYEKQLKADKGVSRLLVFGDSDWILNANIGWYYNRDLILNSLNWLVGEELGLAIRARTIRRSLAPISRDSFVIILIFSFILPEFFLLIGLFIWWKRKTINI